MPHFDPSILSNKDKGKDEKTTTVPFSSLFIHVPCLFPEVFHVGRPCSPTHQLTRSPATHAKSRPATERRSSVGFNVEPSEATTLITVYKCLSSCLSWGTQDHVGVRCFLTFCIVGHKKSLFVSRRRRICQSLPTTSLFAKVWVECGIKGSSKEICDIVILPLDFPHRNLLPGDLEHVSLILGSI